MLRDNTDRTWFSRLLRHPGRKLSRSILTTAEHAQGYGHRYTSSSTVSMWFNADTAFCHQYFSATPHSMSAIHSLCKHYRNKHWQQKA